MTSNTHNPFGKISARVMEPETLGWVSSGEGWWTHRVTGARYLPPPNIPFKIFVPTWMDDDDIKALSKTGGME